MKRISFESNKFPSQILTNVCTIPLYEQFKQQFPEFRLLGTLTHDSVIPTENGLVRQFRVSVERSLRLLVVTSGTKTLPVRRDIRILVVKKRLRLGRQSPRDCTDNADKFADKIISWSQTQ